MSRYECMGKSFWGCVTDNHSKYGSGLLGVGIGGGSTLGSVTAAAAGLSGLSQVLAIPGVGLAGYDLGVLLNSMAYCQHIVCCKNGNEL